MPSATTELENPLGTRFWACCSCSLTKLRLFCREPADSTQDLSEGSDCIQCLEQGRCPAERMLLNTSERQAETEDPVPDR